MLRNARRPGADEACWLVETPSGARQLVPQAWCQPAPDGPAPAPTLHPVLAPVDVTTLRRLAIMVRQLSASQEPHHEPTAAARPADPPIPAPTTPTLVWPALPPERQQQALLILAQMLQHSLHPEASHDQPA